MALRLLVCVILHLTVIYLAARLGWARLGTSSLLACGAADLSLALLSDPQLHVSAAYDSHCVSCILWQPVASVPQSCRHMLLIASLSKRSQFGAAVPVAQLVQPHSTSAHGTAASFTRRRFAHVTPSIGARRAERFSAHCAAE